MNSKSILKRILPILIALLVILVVVVIASVATKDKKVPGFKDKSYGKESFITYTTADGNEIKLSRNAVYEALRGTSSDQSVITSTTVNEIINMIDEDLLKDYIAYYNSHYLERTHPYNGITEVITRLKSDGMLIACVSNKDDEPSKRLIEHFFPGLFDYVSGSVEGVERKPSAEPVQRCLNALGVNENEAVYIGDSDTDIKTAVNSGLDIISCTWGYRTHAFLLENGASHICTAPVDLGTYMR